MNSDKEIYEKHLDDLTRQLTTQWGTFNDSAKRVIRTTLLVSGASALGFILIKKLLSSDKKEDQQLSTEKKHDQGADIFWSTIGSAVLATGLELAKKRLMEFLDKEDKKNLDHESEA